MKVSDAIGKISYLRNKQAVYAAVMAYLSDFQPTDVGPGLRSTVDTEPDFGEALNDGALGTVMEEIGENHVRVTAELDQVCQLEVVDGGRSDE